LIFILAFHQFHPLAQGNFSTVPSTAGVVCIRLVSFSFCFCLPQGGSACLNPETSGRIKIILILEATSAPAVAFIVHWKNIGVITTAAPCSDIFHAALKENYAREQADPTLRGWLIAFFCD
jgi:hypothetical protein